MKKAYSLNEQPYCPTCGKQLETNNMVAKDFVVCDCGGKPMCPENYLPIGNSSKDRCGWCNAVYIATPTEDKTQIIFSSPLDKP